MTQATSENNPCPAPHCGRPMRPGALVCYRCWYVVPDHLKRNLRAAREAVKRNRTAVNIESLETARQRILDSLTPGSAC